MAQLLAVTGPPGAGKSTAARVLAARFARSVLVEGDAFFNFLAAGAIEPWRPESDAQNDVVTRAAAAATGAFVRGGFDAVYDGVLGPWFLPVFAHATGLDALHYVVLMPDVERCVRRVDERHHHAFRDEAATRKMHREFAVATVEDRHVLRDPPDDVEAVVTAIVAGVESGRFAYAVGS